MGAYGTPTYIAASASRACSSPLPDRITIGRSAERRRTTRACAIRRVRSSASRYVRQRQPRRHRARPETSDPVPDRPNGSSRSVSVSGYGPSAWGERRVEPPAFAAPNRDVGRQDRRSERRHRAVRRPERFGVIQSRGRSPLRKRGQTRSQSRNVRPDRASSTSSGAGRHRSP